MSLLVFGTQRFLFGWNIICTTKTFCQPSHSEYQRNVLVDSCESGLKMGGLFLKPPGEIGYIDLVVHVVCFL